MPEPEIAERDHMFPTWDAPIAGSIVVPPGIASRVRIPIPGTVLPNLPKGLVVTLQPPRDFSGSTSAIFFRNPEDKRFGNPLIRLDFGPNKATGRIDYHWNVKVAPAPEFFSRI